MKTSKKQKKQKKAKKPIADKFDCGEYKIELEMVNVS